ncbi:MAG: PilN domain-containing protein [Thermodesulfobacteriota bacterium]
MIKINLIPVEERKQVEGLGQFVFGLFIILLVIGAMIAVVIVQNQKINTIKDETAMVNKRIKELDVIRKKVEKFKVQNKKLEERIKVIAQLEKNRVGPLYVMDALSSKIPERAWIDGFSTRGSSASLTGIASSEFVISEFMRSLESSPHFTYINLSKIRNTRVSGQLFKTFGLGVGVNYFKPPDEPAIDGSNATDKTVVTTGDSTIIQTTGDKSVVTEGIEFIDKSKTELEEESEIKDNKEKKPETKKKPTTGVVGSDDGSNVIVF